MKVIQLLPELNEGGVERGVLEVGKYLTEQGHESIVISNGGRLAEKLEAEGSRHITLPVHKKRLSSLKQVKCLRRLCKQEQPDILHLRSRLARLPRLAQNGPADSSASGHHRPRVLLGQRLLCHHGKGGARHRRLLQRQRLGAHQLDTLICRSVILKQRCRIGTRQH